MNQISAVDQVRNPSVSRKPRAVRSHARAPRPAAGQVRLRMGALGLTPLGVHVVATVDSVGPEVVGFAPGDRVAMREPSPRAGFQRVVSERELIGIPKDVSFDDAAALLASGLVARTILKQLHSVGRGNRISVAPDPAGTDRFVTAWAHHIGADVVDAGDGNVDVSIGASDYSAAARWRYGHGLAQLAASDVFTAMRDGAFSSMEVARLPLSEASRVHSDVEAGRTTGPVVLLPGMGELAA